VEDKNGGNRGGLRAGINRRPYFSARSEHLLANPSNETTLNEKPCPQFISGQGFGFSQFPAAPYFGSLAAYPQNQGTVSASGC
jgi:hypothetical protein